MRSSIIIFFLTIAFLCSGCQQTEILEPDTAYKEKTVVFSILKESKTFEGVTLTKTLPLSVPYDIKKAEIKDATVYLKVNGLRVVPLVYDKDGLYKPLNFLSIHAGDIYELFIITSNKRLYARTSIPEKPIINEVHIVDGKYYVANVATRSNEVYGIAWVIPGAKEFTFLGAAQDFQEITPPESIKPESSISLRTIDIPQVYQSGSYLRAAVVKAFAFDVQYYNYFKTKSNSQQITNSFTQGSGQTMWNIVGDDAIGLFMGFAEGNPVKPN